MSFDPSNSVMPPLAATPCARFAPPRDWPRAELGEALAAGVTGPSCPHCLARATVSTVVRDWSGVWSEDWECGHCGESGWVVDGRLAFVPEGAEA